MFENKQVTPPFKPVTASDLSTENIDKTFTREIPRETPEDSIMAQKAKFDNFTFIQDSRIAL